MRGFNSANKSLIWFSFGNFSYLVSQWLMSYLVTVLLGYSDAGVFSLAMSISSTFSYIALFGMRSFQASDIKYQFSDTDYFLSRIVTSFLCFASCCGFLSINYYSPMIAISILVYLVFKILEAFSDVLYGIMQRELHMEVIGKSFFIKSGLELGVFLIVIVIFRSLPLALLALVAISLFVTIFYDFKQTLNLSSNMTLKGISFSSLKSLLISCLPLAVFGFMFNSMGQIPRYLLEHISGAEALGIYSSVALPVTTIQVFANYIFAPFITPLSIEYNQKNFNKFRALIIKIMVFLSIVGFFGVLLFTICANKIYPLLYGSTILSYTYLVLPLAVCGCIIAFSWFLCDLMIVLRKIKTLLVSSVAAFLITVLICPFAIKYFDLNGPTIGYISGLVLFSGICGSTLFLVMIKLKK